MALSSYGSVDFLSRNSKLYVLPYTANYNQCSVPVVDRYGRNGEGSFREACEQEHEPPEHEPVELERGRHVRRLEEQPGRRGRGGPEVGRYREVADLRPAQDEHRSVLHRERAPPEQGQQRGGRDEDGLRRQAEVH